jgi:ribosomal protein S18 acetylase RimI-like enzyme
MKKISIRRARPGDANAIIAIDPIAAQDLRRRQFIRRSIQNKICWVAATRYAILGYAVFNRSFYDRWFMEMLHVDKKERGKGIGRALMDFIERHCAKSHLFTSTNRSNKRMQKLLSKRGFRRSGIVYNLDPGDPEWVYIKKLTISSSKKTP